MKINIVLPDHAKRIYGGYSVLFCYANFLSKKGHEITIYYMVTDFMERKKIPPIIQRPVAKFLSNYYPRWYKLDKRINRVGILKEDDIVDGDVIIATEIRTIHLVSGLNNSKGKKVHFIQDHEVWLEKEELVNKTYGNGMTNIVVSNWLKKIVDKHSNVPSICIKNGVDPLIFNYDARIKKTNHSIAFHYRRGEYKGGDIAIAVIRKLYKEYPDLIVDVVTSEASFPELPECCIKHSRISPAEVADINKRTKVFLCTSREEGFGLPGLEAMACGAVLVSTRYRGVLEYAANFDRVTGEGNSILEDIDDVEGLIRSISMIYDDDSLFDVVQKASLKKAADMSTDKAAGMFESVLLNIISH